MAVVVAGGDGGATEEATPTPIPTPLAIAAPVLATIDTAIEPSADELTIFQGAVTTVLGEEVQVATERPIEVTTTDKGLVVTLPASGQTAGQQVAGHLIVTLGNLTLETADGQGRATIHLGEGLSVGSDARLEVTEAGIDVVMAEPNLNFVPRAPDVATLAGDSAEVAEVGVEFNVDLVNLDSLVKSLCRSN